MATRNHRNAYPAHAELATRGTARLYPTTQPAKRDHKAERHAANRKPGGRALRVLAAMFGGSQ